MTHLARVVIPGLLHHLTQRGNRRQQVFFSDEEVTVTLYEIGVSLAAP